MISQTVIMITIVKIMLAGHSSCSCSCSVQTSDVPLLPLPLPRSALPAAMIYDLRELPGKEALQLRADVAKEWEVAGQQRSTIEKMVARLAKQGI